MRIGILGAGSIGCYIGGHLIRGGHDVVLVGRQRLRDEVAAHGLRISDADGGDFHLDAKKILVATDSAALGDCDLLLVTVKSADTQTAARAIAASSKRTTRAIVSFQNGIGNAETLRSVLTGYVVVAGMVPWNVVWKDPAHFHRGTSGDLMIEADPVGSTMIAELLCGAGLNTLRHKHLPAVLWGKLLLNLNNPVNALSGLPLRQQLAMRGYRRIVAAMMREALTVMRAAGVQPVKVAKLAPCLIPWVLDLPDAVFLRVAGSLLKLDPEARSSMWEDLQRGRATEIDYINGEVIRLAESIGMKAPLNRAMVALVHEVERDRKGEVAMLPNEMAEALRAVT